MEKEEKGVIRTISKKHLQNAERVVWNTTKGDAVISSGNEMILYGKKGVVLEDYKETEKKFVVNELTSSENIIVVGPQMYQHDSWLRGALFRWDAGPNGKFMFIHQAMRKIFLNPEIPWTVVIYVAGYSKEQIEAMQIAIVNKIGECTFVTINIYDQLYNYINSKDLNNWSGNVTDKRKKEKIRRLQFYCHGLVFRLAMGITNRSSTDSDLDITTDNIYKLKEEAFEKGAKIYSFSCRTGLGNDNIDESVYYEERVSTGLFSSKKVKKQYNLYSAQSLAQKMANTTGGVVYAYLKRSEYSDTLNTADELDFMDAYEAGMKGAKRQRKNAEYDYLLDKSKITATDKSRYAPLRIEKDRRKMISGGRFDPEGAKYPVKAASTPEGLPDDMKTFKKL